MNKVRYALNASNMSELKGYKYTFLKNRQNLSDRQESSLSAMIELYPTLGRACRRQVLFNDLWEMPTKEAATTFLTHWCNEVEEAKIPAFMAFARMVKSHCRVSSTSSNLVAITAY